MRYLVADDFEGRVTFVTGPQRASGKTALVLAALAMLRRRGLAAGILGIGFEGETKGLNSAGARATRIRVEAGELFASASAWLGSTGSDPEILGLLSGSGAFGALALARARRSGSVVLVGPESNDATAEAIAAMRAGGATSILVDGAFGRLTQVASIDGARFFQSVIIDRGSIASTVAAMRRLSSLTALPLIEPSAGAESLVEIEGPLTSEVAARLPNRPALVSIEDFTKVFLEDSALRSLRSRHELVVRRRVDFGGFVVALRGVSRDEFENAWGMPGLSQGRAPGASLPESLVYASPYEEEAATHVA